MATSAKTPPICLGKNWIWPCKDKVFAASPEILRRGFFSYQGGMHHPVVSRKSRAVQIRSKMPVVSQCRLQCFYAHPKQASISIPFFFTQAAKGFCSIFQISRSFVIHDSRSMLFRCTEQHNRPIEAIFQKLSMCVVPFLFKKQQPSFISFFH